MKTKQEEALIQVWKKLDGMWCHHLDGSDLSPVPARFKGDWQKAVAERKERGEHGAEFQAFDIVFNEIQHIIRDALPEELKKEIRP